MPVRTTGRFPVARLFRTPGGRRTAVAFTTPARLLAALGRDHPWITLSATALRSLVSPLGCSTLTVDPHAVVGPAARRSPRGPSGHR